MLYQRVEEQRALVECTQRAVARGRRTIVEANRLLRFEEPARSRDTRTPRGGDRTGALLKIADRLDAIHHRLLECSTTVEMEMDRLDVACGDIDRLTAGPHERGQ